MARICKEPETDIGNAKCSDQRSLKIFRAFSPNLQTGFKHTPAIFGVLIAYFFVGKMLFALSASGMDIGNVISQHFVRAQHLQQEEAKNGLNKEASAAMQHSIIAWLPNRHVASFHTWRQNSHLGCFR